MAARRANIVNIEEVEPRTMSKGARFGFSARRLGPEAGAKSLGCSWYQIEPGKTAFPHHYHCANEEAVFILEGAGEARIGDRTEQVRAGDYIAYPVGPDHAHSLKNTGSVPLKYLAFSTTLPTDVVGYPDSKKVAAVGALSLAKGMMSNPDVWIRQINREGDSLDYYDGEETGE
jgi:uncharacterized cupin superfamily protein